MKASQNNFAKVRGISQSLVVLSVTLALCYGAMAQSKSTPAKAGITGRYEGTAKNTAGEVIPVTLELTEKDGALTGTIRSSHGDFAITGGSHKGEDMSVEFDVGGPTGTLTLKLAEDKLTGTWSAGEDGGPVDVKKVAEGAEKGKS